MAAESHRQDVKQLVQHVYICYAFHLQKHYSVECSIKRDRVLWILSLKKIISPVKAADRAVFYRKPDTMSLKRRS